MPMTGSAPMRICAPTPSGKHGEGLAIYVILDEQRRVVVLRVL